MHPLTAGSVISRVFGSRPKPTAEEIAAKQVLEAKRKQQEKEEEEAKNKDDGDGSNSGEDSGDDGSSGMSSGSEDDFDVESVGKSRCVEVLADLPCWAEVRSSVPSRGLYLYALIRVSTMTPTLPLPLPLTLVRTHLALTPYAHARTHLS